MHHERHPSIPLKARLPTVTPARLAPVMLQACILSQGSLNTLNAAKKSTGCCRNAFRYVVIYIATNCGEQDFDE